MTGFAYRGRSFRPCLTRYHLGCIRVGEPFQTRLRKGQGLSYPSLKHLPPLVCEACTVRVQIGRELVHSPADRSLMALERIRMIDVAHHLAPSTWNTYGTAFNRFNKFEARYPGVSIRRPPPMDHPDDSPAIAAEWCQQEHTLQTPKGNHANSGDRVSYDTSRQSRSALSAWYKMAFAIAYPQRATTIDRGNKVALVDQCIPSSELSYTLMSAGMSKRLGGGSTPPAALTQKQVLWGDMRCRLLYAACSNDVQRLEYLTAGAANCADWLSWLRSNELFSLDWEDVFVVQPADGPRLGLEPGQGCIGLQLLPETKTCRTSRADQYISYNSSSGLSLGGWLDDLRDLHQTMFGATAGPIFRRVDGTRWTGPYFLNEFLHPWLSEQQRAGDPYLEGFVDSNGICTLKTRFYSMGSYRRGGRSHVQRKRPGCVRRATPAEIYEHGRWSRKSGSETAIIHYHEMSIADKLDLTMLCM